ncbi:neuraminidase-like domain-containing protein [Mycetohabitans rhizoxinica]|uniref:Toxin n=1 Tax=Mycetohabitans rhizoxinica TaxID=412963 RepID=A0ABZ2PS59_9BURK
MTTSIEGKLNEALRDALVDYVLEEVIPNHKDFRSEWKLTSKVKTPNDLYQFLLLDPLVTQNVETSWVASAIASVQQYVNAIIMNMEPGYQIRGVESHDMAEWRDQKSQYPIWAASQQLSFHPSIYLDPALRLKKSAYFEELETAITQNRIQADSVQSAVLAYLAKFEEVANLSIINGYASSDDFANATYYFVGRSSAENAYYWRSVDMSDRAKESGSIEHKVDTINPGAWSDWKRIDLPVGEATIERTIRPIFFNNRLFIVWLDWYPTGAPKGEPLPVADKTSRAADDSSPAIRPQIRLNAIYKKYDDSWSAIRSYIDTMAPADISLAEFDTIAVHDSSAQPYKMMLSVYGNYVKGDSQEGKQDKCAFLHNIAVDPSFKTERIWPQDEEKMDAMTETQEVGIKSSPGTEHYMRRIVRHFAQDINIERRFQHAFSIFPKLKSVQTKSFHSDQNKEWNWNWQGNQQYISDMRADSEVKFDSIASKLSITLGLNRSIVFDYQGVQINGCRLIYTEIYEKGFYFLKNISSEDIIINVNNNSKSLFSIIPPLTGGGSRFFYFKDGLRLPPGEKVDITEYYSNGEGFIGDGSYSMNDGFLLIDSGTLSTISIPNPNAIFRLVLWRSKNQDPEKNNPPPIKMEEVPLNIGNEYKDILPNTAILSTTIDINPNTLVPDGWGHADSNKKIYIQPGIWVKDGSKDIAWPRRLTEIELEVGGFNGKSPRIARNADNRLGVVEFIDFAGSRAEKSDDGQTPRRPIRMNTLFVKDLINRANIALERLLSWDSQMIEEPAITGTAVETMDFKGANGLYFWELFFHLPFMIAHRFHTEQRFADSDEWLNFIFNPAYRRQEGSDRPDYWNVRPIAPEYERPALEYAVRAPVDPDGVAAAYPVHYRKAVFMLMIRNLIARGDWAYRELTPDSLGEAKLWYMRALNLLGPRPNAGATNYWSPITLGELAQTKNLALRELENEVAQTPSVFDDGQRSQKASPASSSGGQWVPSTVRPLPRVLLMHTEPDPTLSVLDTDKFKVPMNTLLVEMWDIIESRLRNLRDSRTIDGKALQLPLFAPPLDPKALLARFAAGGTARSGGRLALAVVPHYRYSVMYGRALNAVETLIQFGNTLLAMLERRDQAELQERGQAHVWELSEFAIELQRATQAVDATNEEALKASQRITRARIRFYEQLLREGVLSEENQADEMRRAAGIVESTYGIARGTALALDIAPNVFGLANGGSNYSSVPEGIATGVAAVARTMYTSAESLATTASYKRREQEWKLALEQAQLEEEQIDEQLKVLQAQTQATRVQLRHAERAQEQARELMDFLATRFTNASLCQWLASQASTFYYQAYDAVLSLCLAAEAAWQYEMGDFTTRFIQPGTWKDAYRGLLVGEGLKLNLIKMDAAYLARNERPLEIVKTVSLKQLLGENWNESLTDSQKNEGDYGRITFNLCETDFDDDYPGLYQRRITRVSVSLPGILGPYENVCATLTQAYNAFLASPDPDGAKFLRGEAQVAPSSVVQNLRASQQVALSTGIDDDGLFIMRFDDERYLPFEGTGAHSSWELAFPNPSRQQALLASLTDVIVRVHYTAKNGGEAFAQSVAQTRHR